MDRTAARRLPWELRYRVLPRWSSHARRLAVLATHRHAHVTFEGPVRLGPGFSLDIPGPGTLRVGAGVDFRRRFHCEISGDGRVAIGAGTAFTVDVLIQCSTSIEIGRDCMFAQGVLVVDGSHRFRDTTVTIQRQGYDYRPVRIGDGAAVMAKATVLADVGEHAFVAAHAVVTRPIPAYCLAVGAPARVVDYFGPPQLRPAELG